MVNKRLKEDYQDGELYHGEDVNAITMRVNEHSDELVDMSLVIAQKQDKLIAGPNIIIEGDVISATGGGGGTGSTSIDDSVITSFTTWSSQKINHELDGKQEVLVAGDNITINGNVINATATGGADIDDETESLSKTWSSEKISGLLDEKQGALTQGANISIQNGVISAQQPDISNLATKDEVNAKQGALTAGAGISINNDVISADNPINDLAASTATTYSSSKIDELVGGLGFDTEVVESLPASGRPQVIYLVPNQSDGYDEYVYSNGAWVQIGTTTTDLSDYYTKSQTDSLLNGKQNVISDLADIRSGASLGATALQSIPSEYVTEDEMSSAIATAVEGKQNALTAGQNIQISANTISAQGYRFYPDNAAMRVGSGTTTLSTNNAELAAGRYNRSHHNNENASAQTLVSVGIGTGDTNAARVNAVEVMQNGDVYVNGVGGFDGKALSGSKTLQKAISDVEEDSTDAITLANAASTNASSAMTVANSAQTLASTAVQPANTNGITKIWRGSKASYDALSEKRDDTLYIIR